ncbi:MAG: NUDIX hydrolase [Woeseiaceae bacterium]
MAAIIHQAERFLLVEETIQGKLVINQPAGHLESNESLIEAVIRETLEETRWDFSPKYISGLYQWQHENGETYLRICFVGDITKEHSQLNLDTGIEQVIWMSEQEIKEHESLRSPLVIKSIDDYLSGHKFPISLIQEIY